MSVSTAIRHKRLPRLAVFATVPLLALAGCSKTVDKDDLEKEVKSALESQAGIPDATVQCADDLEAKKGATVKCELEAKGSKGTATIEVKSVDGSDIQWEIVDIEEK
ncbi:uncharacterized protein DUF4333 [Antricoccus suffuscus]|uniref:Uncharacterized protein DUF4333 n=1 Tax=Antricoccus suffuscus TaxID=1629062 RepID=A0A2T1A044_9ACTN|nr:DUF4333 domain-containing protein [Antricoccus suffuscus]PRZ41973.1 uncharacterized protein DUF4333 [Antricoccus suffuscus]